MLLEEAEQKIELLEGSSAIQEITRQASKNTAQGIPRAQEHQNVQAEYECWKKVFEGLAEIQNVLEQIEQFERRRGALTRGAGA
jgi:hypothetical protein